MFHHIRTLNLVTMQEDKIECNSEKAARETLALLQATAPSHMHYWIEEPCLVKDGNAWHVVHAPLTSPNLS